MPEIDETNAPLRDDARQEPRAGGSLDEEKIDRLEGLVRRLENSGLTEYVNLSTNLKKVLMLNFLSGVVRGLGFTVGTTIILAMVYKVMSDIISMNIPYITDMLIDFVSFIKKVR